MSKGLSIVLLLILAVSGLPQKTQPAAKRAKTDRVAGKSKASAAVPSANKKKPGPGTTSKKKVTAKADSAAEPTEPKPLPTPVDPDADQKSFDKAIAAALTEEKARLLRAFLDEFPDSTLREDAFSYLVTARAVVGNEKLQAGNTADGIANFKLAVEEAPLPVPDRIFTDIILKFPAALFYRDQRAAAAELARLIEKKVAANPKQLLGVATFYLGIENGSEAKRVAEAAIALDPNSAAGYQALGLAHRLNFDVEESHKAYSKAFELDSSSVPAQRSLAEMKRALGKPDEAAEIYRSIVVANDKDAIAQSGLVLSLFDSGVQADAERELARALDRDAKNFSLLAAVAYWYAANNQGGKAVEYAQKAIDAEPRYVWSHIALARGLMKQNKPVEAERALIKARQYGNFPTLEYEIASARFKAGLYREAVEELSKSFSLQDGMLRTKLGGRISKEGKSFQELVADERRASILQPTAADDAEASARMRILFEISRKIDESPDESEIATLADEFVKGDDTMKLHRQLYVANLLLQKNIALLKVAELVKASIGNAESGLNVSAPAAAVMASELYESRTVAFSRNEVIVIPDVPRQTLSAILRGRIEELAGWTLYQQKNYPDAVVRLRRAISVLPDKSAWWRSSMWRLGAALEADGKEPEALDIYIQTYRTDRPSALRYGTIEALYQKVKGNTEGLEEKIGPSPISTVAMNTPGGAETAIAAADPTRTTADPGQNSEVRSQKADGKGKKPVLQIPDAVPADKKTVDAATLAETKAKVEAEKTDLKTPPVAEPAVSQKEIEVKTEPASVKPADIQSTITAENLPLTAKEGIPQKPDERAVVVEDKPMPADRTAIEIVDRAKERPVSEQKIEASADASKTSSDADSAKTETGKPPDSGKLKDPEPPAASKEVSTVNRDDQNVSAAESKVKPEPDLPIVESTPGEKIEQQVEKEKKTSELKAEPIADAAKQDQAGLIEATTKPDDSKVLDVAEKETSDRVPEAAEKSGLPIKNEPAANEPANLLRDPFVDPPAGSKPAATPERKPLIIIEDLVKPVKPAEKALKTKELFEPVIITVPRSAGPVKTKDPKTAESRAEDKEEPGSKQAETEVSSGSTRRRVVEGKEILSDQRCSIEVSQEVISLLSGGGSIGILVRIVGDGQMKDITASSTNFRDIDVRPEPEIEGVSGRRFYVIKSISDKVGIFQVNFESPCGKKEITVHVR